MNVTSHTDIPQSAQIPRNWRVRYGGGAIKLQLMDNDLVVQTLQFTPAEAREVVASLNAAVNA